ncbi:MAG: hydroxypyruvate isomerase [Lentisphaerae bacterium ADurb.BinA184]|nr:MAG: hydroxypyruvate isomerase [Lentisphaerae bacterium ADurb.BinA184]
MQFGVCTGPESAAALKAAGFDYIEVNVQAHLKPESPEPDVAPVLAALKASPLPCAAANCFLPAHLKVTGPEVKLPALEAYVRTACRRARAVGMQTIVFGSGGARRIPDGFPRDRAWAQLVAFGRLAAPIAAAHGVTIVVEPLNRAECNVLTTVAESANLVREVDHPGLRLLVDAFHWGRDNDGWADLAAAGPLLRHAHIATYTTRRAPGLEPCDFGPFFQALARGGYDGRISVEGAWQDMASDAPAVLAELRRAARPPA